MGFQKGNKFGGRKKGSKNKITKKIKDRLLFIVNDNMDLLQDDLDHLTPKERVKAITDLIAYTTPKLKSVDIDAKVTPISDMSEHKIKQLERVNEVMLESNAGGKKELNEGIDEEE